MSIIRVNNIHFVATFEDTAVGLNAVFGLGTAFFDLLGLLLLLFLLRSALIRGHPIEVNPLIFRVQLNCALMRPLLAWFNLLRLHISRLNFLISIHLRQFVRMDPSFVLAYRPWIELHGWLQALRRVLILRLRGRISVARDDLVSVGHLLLLKLIWSCEQLPGSVSPLPHLGRASFEQILNLVESIEPLHLLLVH